MIYLGGLAMPTHYLHNFRFGHTIYTICTHLQHIQDLCRVVSNTDTIGLLEPPKPLLRLVCSIPDATNCSLRRLVRLFDLFIDGVDDSSEYMCRFTRRSRSRDLRGGLRLLALTAGARYSRLCVCVLYEVAAPLYF